MTDLELRHLTEESLDDMIEVLAKARANNPHDRRLTRDEAREYTYLDPEFDPKGSWLALLNGKPIGFCSVLIMRNRIDAGMNDAYLDVDIIPEHRRKGAEQMLLEKGLSYIRSRGVGKALSRSLADDRWAQAFLASNSFKEDYRIHTLCRSGRERIEDVDLPEGFRLESKAFANLTDEETMAVLDVLNDSFQDHMNFAPEMPERFINFRNCSEDPKAIAFALKDDVPVGFCLSEESAGFNQEKGTKVGWVDLIGVRPSFRRIGLGKALLADGVNWILSMGMDKVYLGAYAVNEKALDLYRSFGFSKERESIWYSRVVEKL